MSIAKDIDELRIMDNSHNNLHCNNNYFFNEFWHKGGRLVIPFTLNFLYKYGESIVAETFLTVNDFITFVLQFILGFGIAFQLPIIMYLFSLSGLTGSKFWQKNFRYANTRWKRGHKWFVALPMIALYPVGIIAI